MRTLVAMQPTYLPWCGYLSLMDRADVFVFLDSVQFNHRSWQHRNRIKTAQGELMLTIPVLTKGKRRQLINEVMIDHSQTALEKHRKSIQRAYAKAPFLSRYFAALAEMLSCREPFLADLNVAIIEWLRSCLGMTTATVRSSTLPVAGANVELLVNLCKELDADHYLSPGGSRCYIDDNNLFDVHGIKLSYQKYVHPTYSQLHPPFAPYMSVIDLMMNEGENSLKIIRSGETG